MFNRPFYQVHREYVKKKKADKWNSTFRYITWEGRGGGNKILNSDGFYERHKTRQNPREERQKTVQKRRSTSKLNDACLLRVFSFFLPFSLFSAPLLFVNYLNNVTRRNQASEPPSKSYFFKDCIWLNLEFDQPMYVQRAFEARNLRKFAEIWGLQFEEKIKKTNNKEANVTGLDTRQRTKFYSLLNYLMIKDAAKSRRGKYFSLV